MNEIYNNGIIQNYNEPISPESKKKHFPPRCQMHTRKPSNAHARLSPNSYQQNKSTTHQKRHHLIGKKNESCSQDKTNSNREKRKCPIFSRLFCHVNSRGQEWPVWGCQHHLWMTIEIIQWLLEFTKKKITVYKMPYKWHWNY